MKALILGFGTTGLHCARELQRRGHEATGVARSDRLAEEAAHDEIGFVRGDIAHPGEFPMLGWPFDAILICAATKPGDEPRDPWALYVEAHRRLRDWLATQPRCERLLIFSNTSVYGDGSVLPDGTIDESSPLDPRARGDRSRGGPPTMSNYTAAMEEVWRESDLPWILLRIPGIRKPESDAFERMISRPEWNPPAEDRTYQTIHVEALARTVAHIAEVGEPHTIYNLTPPRVNSRVRRAKAAAAAIGRQVDRWPPEANLASHAMIVGRNLERIGLRLTEADG